MSSDQLVGLFKKHAKWPVVLKLAKMVRQQSGRVLVVGGAVRDGLMKTNRLESKDLDLEVFGLSRSSLLAVLKQLESDPKLARKLKEQSRLKEMGKQFGVFNLFGLDIALPRTDSRTGSGLGRKPKVISQPGLDFTQAARRRDLTINAMGYDPLTHELLDPYDGRKDLKAKILRAVDPDFFGDDPLRVLRVMQFAARFGFAVDQKTIKLCQQTDLSHIAKERVGEEWQKLLFKADHPGFGLKTAFLLKIPQRMHPDFLVWLRRNFHKLDLAVNLANKSKLDAEKTTVFILYTLTQGADEVRVRKFLSELSFSGRVIERVVQLQSLLIKLQRLKSIDRYQVRRLAIDLAKISLSISDLSGVAKLIKLRSMASLMTQAKRLHVLDKAPKNLISGQDLIKLGFKPGKKMGEILNEVFDKQLRGEFDDRNFKPNRALALSKLKQIAVDNN